MQYSLIATALVLASSGVQAYTLDFGNGPEIPSICTTAENGSGATQACANKLFISGSYGDVAGVVDVSYLSPNFEAPATLRWWQSNYNDLFGVLYSGSGPARIELKPAVAGTLITLNSFDMGAWFNRTGQTTVNVATSDGVILGSYSGPIGMGSTNHYTWDKPVSSTTGLRIEFMDEAHFVGIDNINFSVGAVPEPSTYGLMLAGLMGIGIVARHRRR